MTPAERKLAIFLLKLAAEEFSNHGCNDLELVRDVGLTPEESLEVRQAMHAWSGDRLADAPHPDQHYTMDWLAMQFVVGRIEAP